MPEAQDMFQNAVTRILEAVMFENWLRFYFIVEKPDTGSAGGACADGEKPLFLAVPDKGMEKIKEICPHLLPMAEMMNNKEVDFETSRRVVCLFVTEHLDGAVMPRDTAPAVLESTTFQTQMQLFTIWVQTHEHALDANFLDFAAWRRLFAEWHAAPSTRELSEKLLCSAQPTPGACGTNTEQ